MSPHNSSFQLEILGETVHSAPLRVLGSRIDRVTAREALARVRQMAASQDPHQVVTGNTLMVLAAHQDAALRAVIEGAALVVPESWGIAWASRLLDRPLLEFFPGIDFMVRLCEQARNDGDPIFMLGAAPGIAESAAQRLLARFPGLTIAGCHHGYFSRDEESAVFEKVRIAAPRYLFVARNVPEQEKWIALHLRELDAPVVIGVGGSFDVLSGRLRRAPLWMRKLGIEWVFRAFQQPWRLKRIKDLPIFMWRVWRSRAGLSR